MVRKLRESMPLQDKAYFYLSPMLNTKVHKKTEKLQDELQRKDLRKTAKRLIKQAKKNPQLWTDSDVMYAKMIKRQNKKQKHEDLP